jgi:hypothetical protein
VQELMSCTRERNSIVATTSRAYRCLLCAIPKVVAMMVATQRSGEQTLRGKGCLLRGSSHHSGCARESCRLAVNRRRWAKIRPDRPSQNRCVDAKLIVSSSRSSPRISLAQPQTSVRRRFRVREPCPWPYRLLARATVPATALTREASARRSAHTGAMADEPFVTCRASVLGAPSLPSPCFPYYHN